MAHFLLTPFGSAGDVNPFLWMGRLLQARGHHVEVITAPMFQGFTENLGLPFTGIGNEAEIEQIIHHPDLWKPFRGTKLVFEYGAKLLRPCFDAIASRVRGKETVLVSPFHQIASRLAREKLGVPLVTIHLQPACFLSAYDMPLLLPGTEWFLKMPTWVKRLVFSIPIPAAAKMKPALHQLCRELKVPPPRHILPDWIHSPDANLAFFPEWFAAPQPDWPPNTHAVGFPLEDLKSSFPIPAELAAWLEQGDKPVLLSPGSGNVQAREFFREGIAACERLGRRALLGTRFPEQLPHPLPPHARQFEYLPFSELLPRVCALVHHGGIGTMSQAFAAGVPQLVMPMGHDQPDNAHRMKQLGAGEALPPKKFTADRVAECLRRLITSPDIAASCTKVATLCKAMNVAGKTVDVLENVIKSR
jgi:UDP:flavonoid glycosyltransferase YjiC (YdhE family)